MITVILLLGVTAINAVNVDGGNQTNIEQTEVSTTSHVDTTSDVKETTSNMKTNEKDTNYEKATNTQTKTIDTDTTHSKNIKQTPSGNSQPRYIYVRPHYVGTINNPPAGGVKANERGNAAGTINNPTDIYTAFGRVQDNPNSYDVIYMMADDNAAETVYESEDYAVYIDPNKPITVTVIGEPGKTIVWSGKNWTTNMLSISDGSVVTVQNVVFRDGNASGISRGSQSWQKTADVGGAIDNRGTLHAINCTFERILANQYGGAIANYDNANAIIEDCTFKYINSTNDTNLHSDANLAYGGAISATNTNGYAPQVTIKNSNFTNVTGENGAVILNNGGILNIENINIVNATATVEGGAIINDAGTMNIKNITVSNVSSRRFGGVIANHDTAIIDGLTVHNSTIIYDHDIDYDEDQYGGTIYNEGTLTIKNSQLDNLTSAWGGVFSNNGGTLEVDNVTAHDVYASYNGGLLLNYNYGETTITNSNFSNINATFEPPQGNGAGIYLVEGTVNFNNNNLSDCNSRGSAIAYNFFGELNMDNNNFTNNHVNGENNYLVMAPMEEFGLTTTNVNNNNFVNNTNVYYGQDNDALFYNQFASATGNTYMNNTLSYNLTVTPQIGQGKLLDHPGDNYDFGIILNGTSNDVDIFFNIRDVYLTSGVNKYINGTLDVFLNDEAYSENPVTVSESDAKITVPVTAFAKYDNNVTVKFTSANKDFLNSEYKFKIYKVLSTNVTANNVEYNVTKGDTFVVEGYLYAMEGKYAGILHGENIKPSLKADPVEITQVPIAGATVTIQVDTDTHGAYTATTNEDGSYSVTIDSTTIDAGIQTIHASYDGLTDYYNDDTDDAQVHIIVVTNLAVNVNQTNVFVGDNITITGTLTEDDGTTPVGPTEITINIGIGNEPIVVQVDENGQFTTGPITINSTQDYNITAVFEGNETHNRSEISTLIDVDIRPIPTELTITSGDVSINGTNNINLQVTDNEGNPINGTVMLSVDGNFVEVPITDGVGLYQYTNTEIGKNVTISGYFEHNPTKGYLKSPTKSTDFEVLKLGTDITITNSSDVTAHKEATATVTLAHDGQPVSGEVLNVVIKDEYDNILATVIEAETNSNGQVEVNFTPITGGKITITADHSENDVYNRSEAEIPVEPILSIATTTTITATNTTINGTSSITVAVTDEDGNPVKGQVQLTINDQEVAETIETDENGIVTYECGSNDAYAPTTGYEIVTISAKYLENTTNGYKESTSQPTTFTVDRLNTTIDIQTEPSIKAHKPTSTTITLSNSTTHLVAGEPVEVIITQDGKTLNSTTLTTDENGQVKVEFTPINTEDIEINVNYAENNVYNANSESETIDDIKSMKTILNITSSDVSINETAKVNLTVTDELDQAVNGTVLLIVDGQFVEVDVIDGKAVYNYTNTQEGKNVTVSGYFKEDEDNGYKQSKTNSTKFEVEKIGLEIDVLVDPESPITAHEEAAAIITVINTTIVDGEEVTKNIKDEEVTVIIKDAEGNVLANVTSKTDEDGQIIVDFVPETDSDITITVEHPENDAYGPASKEEPVEVESMDVTVEITPIENTSINGTTPIEVVVTDDDGNPIVGVNVTLTIDDGLDEPIEVVLTTDEEGKITYPYDDTEVGKTVSVTAQVTDSGYNQEEPATDEFTVDKLDTTITILSETDITAHKPTSANITLTTEEGIIPEDEEVIITVTQGDDVIATITGTIGPDGQVTIDFMPENNQPITISVEYEGSEVYNGDNKDKEIPVNNMGTNVEITPVDDTIIGGTTPVEVVVTDDEGNPVSGAKVELTFVDDSGEEPIITTETVTAGEDGKVTYPYTDTQAGKNVTVTAKVLADEENAYAESEPSQPDTFEVVKLNTTIEIEPESSVTAHKPTSATITLSSDSVPAGEDVLVTVIQNGVKLNETTVKTDDDGKLVVDFTPVNTDDIVITAVYEGSEVYNGNDATTTIGNIKSIATILNITSENVSINGTSNIRLNVTDAEDNPVTGTAIIIVDGQLVEVDVVDGNAVYEYNDTQVGKNVTVTGYFVEDAANGYLKSKVNSTAFEVEKLDINIGIDAPEDITAHKPATVVINLTNDIAGEVVVPGEGVIVTITDNDGNVLANVTAVTNASGQVEVDFTPITDKDVTVNVVHPESDAYIQKTGSETIGDVSVMGTYVDLSAENTTINGTSIITIVVTDNNDDPVSGVNVTLRFEVEGQEPVHVNVTTDEDGVATYEYVDTLVGKNVTVTAISQKDWDHGYADSSIVHGIFEVAKLNTTIEIVPEDVTVQKPTNTTITISNQTSTLAAGENVKVIVTQGDNTLNETTLSTDENGQVIVGYTPETTQPIKISVVYDETPVYNANNADITVNVNKLNTTIAIEPDIPVTAHKETSATITVTSDVGPLPSGQEVTVTIMQNDIELNITTATIGENGQVKVDYTPVNTDDVVITVEYDGDDVYYPSENSAAVGNIRPIDTVMTITADDVSINETALVKVEVVDAEGNPVTGTAIITVDGQLVEVSVTDGVGEYQYINTQIGKNVTVTGYFADNVTNGYVRSPVTSDDFEVEKLPIDMTLEVSPDLTAHVPATATITLTNGTAKEVVVPGEEVIVVITDEEGNVLANVTATTDDAGQVTVDFTPVNTSPITISVEHPENDVYNKASGDATIDDIESIGTDVEITQARDTIINGTSTVEVVVVDDEGNPVVGGTVELTFDDGSDEPLVVTVVTDEDGVATYVYDDTEVGKTVSVSAKLLEDVENGYSESEPVEDEFDVDKLDTIIDIVPEDDIKAHVPTTATVTVSTEEGIVPAGEAVSVVVSQGDIELFNGEVTLDENGQVVVPFTPENTDDIEIMVIFDETDQFNDNEDSIVIDDVAAMGIVMNVTADNTTINGTSTITVTLTDDEGNPISGVVELTVPGVDEPVVVNVDETGIATVPYTNTTEGKNVTITAQLVEPTEGYAPVDPVDVTFEVAKLNTTVAIDPEANVTAHKPTSATITLSSDSVPAGEDVLVTVIQNGVKLNETTVKTDEDGKLVVDFTPVNTDDIVITAVYDGSEVYNGNNATTTIGNIKSIATVLNITSENVSINGTSNIRLNVTDEEGNPVTGTAMLTVDGQLVEVEVVDGSAVYEYNDTAVGKNVTVTGYFVEDAANGYLKSKVNSTTFEVEKLDLNIDVEVPEEVTAHKETSTTITLTNETGDRVAGEEVNVVITDEEGNVLANVTATTDENGQVSVDFTPVNTSPITISVEHPENDVYNKASGDATIDDVDAMGANVVITQAQDTIINGTSTVEVVVVDDEGNPVVGGTVELTFDDGSDDPVVVTVVTDEDGVATYVYDDTEVGKTVSVSAKLLEDVENGYSESEPVEDVFDVYKLDTIIDIVPEDGIKAHVPTNATVTVSTEDGVVPAGEAVSVVVSQGDIELFNGEVTLDENGQVIIPFTPENTDDIEIMVIFDETDQFNDNEDSIVIDDVAAMGIVMNVTADNTTINGTSTITVTLTDDEGNPISGVVELTVPGVDEPVVVNVDETGIATVPYDDTEVGKNVTITAQLVEPTEGYAPVDPVDVTFEVAKLNPTVTIMPETPVTAHKPNSATINVSTEEGIIPEGETVSIVVTQNGKSIATIDGVVSEDGTIVIEYVPETTDDVTISAVFDETPVYNAADNQTTIGNIKSIATVMNITSENVSINGTSNIRLNVTDEEGNPVTGTAILTVDGQLVEVDVVDGSAVYEYNDTVVGKNVTVTGYFEADSENGYLKSKVNSTTFEVEKLDLNIDVEVPEEVTAHKETTATVTLTNDTDKEVVVPGEEVTVVITDEEGNVLANVTATTDENGQVTVDFTPVNTSPITISVEHPENDVYNKASDEVTIDDIESIGTDVEITQARDTIINGTSTVEVVVTDDLGNPVVGGTVELIFDDGSDEPLVVTVVTDEDGVATYVYDDTEDGKTVSVSAKLLEDVENGYSESEPAEDVFDVDKLDTIIDIVPEDDIKAHVPTNATITVSTGEGAIPVGEVVSVVVTQGDNELFNDEVTLDENGQVIIPFTPENTDDIEIIVIFDETDQFYDNEDSIVIDDVAAMGIIMNVTADNTTINGTSTVTITLTDDEGNPVAGNVTLTIPGMDEPVVVEVGEDGIGNYTYNDTSEGKNVTITAELTEPTEGYSPVDPVDVTIEVAKLNVTIDIEPETPVTAHEPNNATITIKTDDNIIPVGEPVSIVVTQNGKPIATIDGVVGEDGTIDIEYMPESTDDVTIGVVFNETSQFNSADATTTIGNIKSTNTYLNITSENVSINGTSHITVNVTDEEGNPVTGTVVLIIDGQLVEVETDDEGMAVYDYNNTTVGKNVTITGYFEADPENGYLKSKTNSTTFEVEKLPIDIALEVSGDLTAHVPAIATVTLTNDTDKSVVVPGEEVTVTIIDQYDNVLAEVTAVTNEDGKVVVGFTPVTNGKVTIAVLHPENDVYVEIAGMAEDTVSPIGTSVEILETHDTIINGTTDVKVVVNDTLGRPVVNQTVELTFTDDEGNTEVVSVITDENGEAVYVYNNTNVGKTVDVTAELLENDDGYATSETEEPVTFTVDKLDVIIDVAPEDDITAHRPTNATITVSTEEGSVPVGEAVSVIVTQGDNELFNDEVTLDENGQVVIPFTPENTDDIEITVIFDETDQYNDNDATEVIDDVSAMGVNMTVTADNTTINGTSVVTINLTDEDGNPLNGTVYVTIPGVDEPVPVEVKDGIGTYEFDDTEVGKNVTITAELEPMDGYDEAEPVDVTIEIAKRNTTIIIEPDAPVTAHKPTSATITVSNETSTLPAGENVTVIVIQDGKEIAKDTLTTDENGQITIPYTPFNAEHIDIVAVYDETPVYLGANNTTEVVNVKYMPTFINITSENVIINGTSHIKVNVTDELGNPVNGTALLIVDGDFVEVNITDGNGLYEYTNTTIGKNVTITGYYVENTTNAYLKSEYNSTTFEVAKLNTTVTAQVANSTITNFTIDVKVDGVDTEGTVENGKVEIYADDVKVGEAEVTDGVAKGIKLDINDVGEYTLTVKYNGNDVFNPNQTTVEDVVATPIETTVKATVTNDTAGNVTIETEVLDANGNKVPDGMVNITITKEDGTTETIGPASVKDGIATITTNINKTGNYNITAEYEGTDKYAPANSTTVPVEVEARDTNVTAAVANDTLGNTTVNVTVTDPTTGEPISNQPVVVTLPDGTNITVKTDENGTAVVPVDLPVGKQNITVTYPGDDTNAPTNITVPVEVQPRPSKVTAKVTNRTAGNVTVQVTVTDDQTNKPVTDGPVDVILVDKYGNEKIIGNGVLNGTNTVPVTVDIDEIGEYNITAKYKGNENYTEGKSNPVTTEVVGRKTDMQVGVANNTVGNTTVNVTVTDPTTGEPIANQPVVVTLPNGTKVTAQTDENGNAVIPVDVLAGKTKLNVSYPGDNTNNPITKQITIDAQKTNVTITIQPINPVKINVTYLINATVKDAYGNLVTEGDVQLLVNGTDIGKVTLTNGTIYKEYSNKQNGVYPVEARYLGSPKYNKDTDNTTVEIIKLETRIDLEDMTAVIGDTIEFVAKVTDENNNPVNNGQLAIKLNGITITDSNNNPVYATVTNGVAKVKFTVPLSWRGQTYQITAVYGGTSRIYESSRGGPNILNLNYRTADIKLTVNPTSSCMDKVVKFTANIVDNATKAKIKNGVVIFKLNGQTLKDAKGNAVQVTVVNGVAIYNYTVLDGMKARDYNITAVYAYKDYSRAEDSANLTITTVKTHFNVTEQIENKVLTIKGKLLDPSNHTTVGENTACVKLNGETIKKADGNIQYFSVNNGIVDINVNVPSKYYNKTITSIEIVTGARYAYEASRLTTKTNIKI